MPAIKSSRSEPSTWLSDNGWLFLSRAFIRLEIRSSVGRVLRCSMAREIFGHFVHRAHQGSVILDPQFEDFVDPFDEELAILFRNAKHMRNRPNRNVLGVARRRVALAVGDEFVDQLVADRADPGLKLLHGVGREW